MCAAGSCWGRWLRLAGEFSVLVLRGLAKRPQVVQEDLNLRSNAKTGCAWSMGRGVRRKPKEDQGKDADGVGA